MGRSPTPMLPTPLAEPMPQTMSTPVAEPMPPKPSPSDTVEVQPVVPERKTRRVIGATLRAFEQVGLLRLDALKRLADALRQCDVDELAGMLGIVVSHQKWLTHLITLRGRSQRGSSGPLFKLGRIFGNRSVWPSRCGR